MSEQSMSVHTDSEVNGQVLGILHSAKEYAVIVTPYIKLWSHAKDAFQLAVRRGVSVTVLFRPERDTPDYVDHADVVWLLETGAKVRAVKKLHSKIYLNEHSVVVSSMNLHQTSAGNNHEIALSILDDASMVKIKDYVDNVLIPLGEEMEVSETTGGFCIRCGEEIPFDPEKPRCRGCYERWRDEEDEYEEDYCHMCGKVAEVYSSKPLCYPCFRSSS